MWDSILNWFAGGDSGDDKSKGAWKAHVARNNRYEAEQKEKLNNLKNDFKK